MYCNFLAKRSVVSSGVKTNFSSGVKNRSVLLLIPK